MGYQQSTSQICNLQVIFYAQIEAFQGFVENLIHLNQELDFENETFEKRFYKVLEMRTSIFKKLM